MRSSHIASTCTGTTLVLRHRHALNHFLTWLPTINPFSNVGARLIKAWLLFNGFFPARFPTSSRLTSRHSFGHRACSCLTAHLHFMLISLCGLLVSGFLLLVGARISHPIRPIHKNRSTSSNIANLLPQHSDNSSELVKRDGSKYVFMHHVRLWTISFLLATLLIPGHVLDPWQCVVFLISIEGGLLNVLFKIIQIRMSLFACVLVILLFKLSPSYSYSLDDWKTDFQMIQSKGMYVS